MEAPFDHNDLLEALANAWRQQSDAERAATQARSKIGELLDTAKAARVPAHRLAYAYLRAQGRPASPFALRRALAVIRKRRQRARRDTVSRQSPAAC